MVAIRLLPFLCISLALITPAPAADDAPFEPIKLKISRATTHVDGPLRSDGLIDYVQAFDKICAEGITAENNAGPLLLKAYGPSLYAQPEAIRFVCRKLEIEVLPDEGEYFVDLMDLVGAVWDAEQAKRDHPGRAKDVDRWLKSIPARYIKKVRENYSSRYQFEVAIDAQHDVILNGPWAGEEYPLWMTWVLLNEKSLELVQQAAERERFYLPHPGEPDTITMLERSLINSRIVFRRVARCLIARAMVRLNEARVPAARGDVLTVYRLAQLFSREPSQLTHLVAMSLEAIARDATDRIAVEGKLTAAQLNRMLADLNALKPREPVLRALEVEARFEALDGVATLMQQLKRPAKEGEKAPPVRPEALLDVNILLRELNIWSDGLAGTASPLTYAGRKRSLEDFSEQLKQKKKEVAERLPGERGTAFLLALNRAIRLPREKWRESFSLDVADLLVTTIISTGGSLTRSDDLSRMSMDLTRLTIALAAYRAEKGQYPAALADLSPDYFKKIPKDRFTDEPLRYTAAGNGFTLYSFGPNQKDDGAMYRANDQTSYADMAVRVRDGKLVPHDKP
ncbi:MAG: hypothetical protein WD768_01285 [Phycisphaeraceae bacterium]